MTDEVGQPRWLGCTIPPEGWWCSREEGHEGPCAARPDETLEEDDSPLSDADKARIDAAWEKHKAAEPTQPAESPEARAIIACMDAMIADPKIDVVGFEKHDARIIRSMLAATTARPTERGAVKLPDVAKGHKRAFIRCPTHGKVGFFDYVPYSLSTAIGVMPCGCDTKAAEVATEADYIAALTPPVTVAATDQAGEVERVANAIERELRRQDSGQDEDPKLEGPDFLVPYIDQGETNMRLVAEAAIAALDTQRATGRTMGGEDGKTAGDDVVIGVVKEYDKAGVTGTDLCGVLEARGFERRSAQRFIQRNLDRGTIVLGKSLRIFPAALQNGGE